MNLIDTVRAMLTRCLYKNHLLKGVKKGVLTEAKEKKFNKWLEEKEIRLNPKYLL